MISGNTEAAVSKTPNLFFISDACQSEFAWNGYSVFAYIGLSIVDANITSVSAAE